MSCTHQAQEQARAILLDYLSPEQRETFQATGHFDVVKTGSSRSLGMILMGYPRFRVYRLSHGRYPVTLFTSPKRLEGSVPNHAYCIHARAAVPHDDELLSMKLLIEQDEPRFVSIADRFRSPEDTARRLFTDPEE